MSRATGKRLSINDINLDSRIVKDLSLDTLKILSNQDDGTFYEFFQGLSLEEVKKARERGETMREKNRELAVANTELEPRFEETKANLRRKCTEATDLQEVYRSKYEELKGFQSRSNPTALKKQLQDGAKASEETSENLATDFVAGKSELSLEAFQEEFMKLRTQYWLRKVKAEKMDELLKNRIPVPAPRSSPRMPHNPTDPARSLPTAAPYPLDPRRMPDPSASLPPYSAQSPPGHVGMPVRSGLPPPGHPFTPSYAAPYHPQGAPGSYPNRPPPVPGYPYNQHRY